MKRGKQDAADLLVASLERAIREYRRSKDAPVVPRTLQLLADEAQDEWPICRHEPRCSHRSAHESAKLLGRPEREAV